MQLSVIALLSTLSVSAAFTPSFGVRSSTQLEARKPFISGNWKLNPQTKGEALTLASDIAATITDDSPDAEVALFVPYVFIEAAMGAVGDKLSVGAEVSSHILCNRSLSDLISYATVLHSGKRNEERSSFPYRLKINDDGHRIHMQILYLCSLYERKF